MTDEEFPRDEAEELGAALGEALLDDQVKGLTEAEVAEYERTARELAEGADWVLKYLGHRKTRMALVKDPEALRALRELCEASKGISEVVSVVLRALRRAQAVAGDEAPATPSMLE